MSRVATHSDHAELITSLAEMRERAELAEAEAKQYKIEADRLRGERDTLRAQNAELTLKIHDLEMYPR